MSQTNLSSFIWSVADLLRGDYKQSDYGKVILPFTVLRRLDCVLEATKEAVLKEKDKRETAGLNPEPFLLKKSGQLFYNTSALDMFYNTGISTYIWILTNRKLKHRRGKVQLIDASAMWQKMRKSLGSKRKELSEDHIAQITKLFGECQEVWLDEKTGEPVSRASVSRTALAAGSSPAGDSAKSSKGKPKTPAASALPLTRKPPRELAEISAQPVRQLPDRTVENSEEVLFLQLSWSHNIVLMQKIKDLPTRLWYARQTLEQGWARETLTDHIKTSAHARQGAAVSNFGNRLPAVHAELASGLLKDPYMFDFLTMEDHFHERELETGLLTHIEKFLLELGRGFAFVGRQYRLDISDRDFYLDLLFYHLQLRCFVVVDLKKGEFKPEYAGKMNFYCSAVDDLLRHEHDQPTLGLILCQTKDRIIAEYSLRDIEKPIGVADDELTRALPEKLASSLPSIEDIEAELSQDLAEDDA